MDIGANVRNFSISFSKYFRKVDAFEPNPEALAEHPFRIARQSLNNMTATVAEAAGLVNVDRMRVNMPPNTCEEKKMRRTVA